MPRVVDGDDPVPPHSSATVIDSEKSSITANRPRSFPTNHQSRLCVTPNFPKMGFRYPKFVGFCKNFDQKRLKVCYKVSLSKNFQQQSCSGINYLSNDNNILAGDDPVPVKFGLQALTPNRKDARFTFHTRHAVQSAIADSFLLVAYFLSPGNVPGGNDFGSFYTDIRPSEPKNAVLSTPWSYIFFPNFPSLKLLPLPPVNCLLPNRPMGVKRINYILWLCCVSITRFHVHNVHLSMQAICGMEIRMTTQTTI